MSPESEKIRAQKIADAKLKRAIEFLGEKWVLHPNCDRHFQCQDRLKLLPDGLRDALS